MTTQPLEHSPEQTDNSWRFAADQLPVSDATRVVAESGLAVYGLMHRSHTALGDGEYMRHRADFVRDQGWFGPDHNDDTDALDHHLSTRYVVSRPIDEHTGERVFGAGARLTEVDAIGMSASFAMMGANTEMQHEILASVEEDPNLKGVQASKALLFDLTRFVTNMDEEYRNSPMRSRAMLQVFGAALKDSERIADLRGKDPKDIVWFFATTQEFHGFLTEAGIPVTVLADSKVSERDNSKTMFCYVKPYEGLKSMEDSDDRRQKAVAMFIRRAYSNAGVFEP